MHHATLESPHAGLTPSSFVPIVQRLGRRAISRLAASYVEEVPRQLRILAPGGLYHVRSRGNERRRIVRDDKDRIRLLRILATAVSRYGWQCHSYCLMDNHLHLMLLTPEPNLDRGMQYLNGVYAQTFNRRHERSGHLFQGRYEATLVENDGHLLEVCRYVVLNPVRAGICADPADWPWSSFRATAGLDPSPAFLSDDAVLELFGKDRPRARAAYAAFVRDAAKRRAA